MSVLPAFLLHIVLIAGLLASSVSVAQQTPFSEYRIGPSDVLSITVWQQPDLTRLVTVRPDGFISFPLLGEMMVAGLTPLQLRNRVATNLEAYLNILISEVTVSVDTVNSYTISVLGQVHTPGRFSFQSQVTVLDVLAEAGGFTPFASTGNVVILRTEEGVVRRIPFDYRRVTRSRSPTPDIKVFPGDIVVVP